MRIAQWFRDNGIKPGDIVSVSSENRIEFSLVPVAGYFVGATFAPFNPEYTAGGDKLIISECRIFINCFNFR